MASHITSSPSNGKPLIEIGRVPIGGSFIETVDARELHAFLESKRDFSSWIKDRIEQYGLVENVDYLLTETGEQLPSGTKYRKEYALTIGTAKELAMVERNAKGKQARQYFIDCERKLKAKRDIRNPQSAALIHMLEQLDELECRGAETRKIAEDVHERMDALETAIEWSTVIGWAKQFQNRNLSPPEAARFGMAATRRAKSLGIKLGSTPDPRFGRVNLYPNGLLGPVWNEIFGEGPLQ